MARYIGGLRPQLQDTVSLFDFISVAAAHQRALVVERQSRRAANTNTWGSGAGSSSSAANISGGNKAASGSGVAGNDRPAGGIRCFGCGEVRHRQSECKKTTRKKTFSSMDRHNSHKIG